MLFLDKGLVERMAAEGENSPADVILTVDIARLTEAKEGGVTQPLKDAAIEAEIPAAYRDPAGDWFGLTTRGRVIYASVDRVKETDLTMRISPIRNGRAGSASATASIPTTSRSLPR